MSAATGAVDRGAVFGGVRFEAARATQPVVPVVIEEDSLFLKTLSCLPCIGLVFHYIQDKSLVEKINQIGNQLGGIDVLGTDAQGRASRREDCWQENRPKLIKIIQVKNQYMEAGVVRSLLSIALVVSGIAFGVISGTVPVLLFAGLAAMACLDIGTFRYQIAENEAMLDALADDSWRGTVRVR